MGFFIQKWLTAFIRKLFLQKSSIMDVRQDSCGNIATLNSPHFCHFLSQFCISDPLRSRQESNFQKSEEREDIIKFINIVKFCHVH